MKLSFELSVVISLYSLLLIHVETATTLQTLRAAHLKIEACHTTASQPDGCLFLISFSVSIFWRWRYGTVVVLCSTHVLHKVPVDPTVLEYGHNNTEKRTQSSKETSNVSQKVQYTVHCACVLDSAQGHFIRYRVMHFVFVGHDSRGCYDFVKAIDLINLNRTDADSVVIHIDLLSLNEIDDICPYINCKWIILEGRRLFYSFLVKVLLDETFQVQMHDDIFELHPFSNLLISLTFS